MRLPEQAAEVSCDISKAFQVFLCLVQLVTQ